MFRTLAITLTALCGIVVGASVLPGQTPVETQWRPPSAAMPAMPAMADLQNNWLRTVEPWFRGIEGTTGAAAARLRVYGEARPGSTRAQVVRVQSGPIPVAVWSDRNGDGRADMIEVYHGGRMVVQLIDSDYSGQANALRFYDENGALIRQERPRR